MKNLPVAAALPELKAALAVAPATILTADTGSGKTTWLPLELLVEPWLNGKKIVMLEPRRVAARAAAARLAHHLGEKPGSRVGYSVRFDSKTSSATRLEVVTEGILARRIVADPELTDAGLVIFDEFHERHVETDLALALTLEAMKVFRPDLKILMMSATIDTSAIQTFLKNFFSAADNPPPVPVVASTGTNFPVAIKYHDATKDARLSSGQTSSSAVQFTLACARKAIEAHKEHAGDLLLFLPGVSEIFTAVEFIEDFRLKDTAVLPLYGELTAVEQDRVLAPPKPGERRIIVATPIAESSLTIDGLTVVIDSGLVRQPALDIGAGISYLETVPITQDSATQRAGRAGRLGPGVCYRMYSEADFRRRPKTRSPEILRTDLAEASLRTLAFGSPLKALALPDMPPPSMLAAAEKLLFDLGCLTSDGRLTALGEKAAKLPLSPRLAVMLAAAPSDDTALLAALLSERPMHSDLEESFQTAKHFVTTKQSPAVFDRHILEAILRTYEHLPRYGAGIPWANALLYAYPDRVAIKRETGSFLTRSGRGVSVEKASPLADAEFIVAVDIAGQGTNAKLRTGIVITFETVVRHFADAIVSRQELHEVDGKPRMVEQRRLGAIVLGEKEIPLAADYAEKLVLQKLRAEGLEKAMGDTAKDLCTRIENLRNLGADVPDSSNPTLLATLDDWLVPFLAGVRSLAQVDDALMAQALAARLSYTQQQTLEDKLPQRLTVPSGASHRIWYSPGKAQVSVRIQEVFGLNAHPRIADGQVPLFIELLSPKKQPIAVTKDLPAFWQSTYADVRKEMRGRYPKHFWPEDPLSMQGTTGTKKAFDRSKS